MENFEGITYKLSHNWLNYIPTSDKPINYLEIGTFHGANLFSVLKNYCTHTESRLYTIDPFQIMMDMMSIRMIRIKIIISL